MCKGLSALPATCLKSAKDMKHRIGFLLHKVDPHHDQPTVAIKDKDTAAKKGPPGDVEKWKESLENLLKSEAGLAAFAAYLKSEFSEENIQFWLACEEYKKTNPNEDLAAKAWKIYDQYVDVGSPREVNLDAASREETKKNLEIPSRSSFEESQRKIFLLMEKDSYRRFLRSKMFVDMSHLEGSMVPCGFEKMRRRHTCNFSQILSPCA